MVARRAVSDGWSVIGFADDAEALRGRSIAGVPVLGSVKNLLSSEEREPRWFHCAIGRNQVRKALAEACEARGLMPATLIDPSAMVAPSAVLGPGTFIASFAFVGPEARVGRHVLVNVGASIGHHSLCGDFTQVCPGARISGHARLAEGAFIGSNGVLAPGVSVGEWATVGAASLAARDVPARATALGVPAKILAVPGA